MGTTQRPAPESLKVWLERDHEEIDALLAAADRGGELDPEAFAEFRRRILQHIAIEEKVVFDEARRRGAAPDRLQRLRLEHGAITTLLIPAPDVALVGEIRGLLRAHNAIEEGPGGVYEACEEVLGDEAREIAERARALPPVKVAAHRDRPGLVRTAREALAKAAGSPLAD